MKNGDIANHVMHARYSLRLHWLSRMATYFFMCISLTLLGMNEVGLHSFVGRCGSDVLESIFPTSDKQTITFEQMKEVMVFEQTEGHKQTITFWHNYLFCCQNMNQVWCSI